MFEGGGEDGRSVLAEAGTAPPEAGLKEARADALIHADALGHGLHVRAHARGQIADFIDIADFQRQESVGGVLDQLGRGGVGGHQRHRGDAFGPGQERRRFEALIDQRLVERDEPLQHARIGGADDDAIGIQGVVDGTTLAQKLGVRADADQALGIAAVALEIGRLNDHPDPFPAADRTVDLLTTTV